MHRSLVQALLASAFSLAFSVTALAQTAIPDTISYQGRVTDASGNAVGAGTAVNRTAYFRIYDNASGGTRIWSEQQTITVANGEFSVLLGTGTGITGETNLNPLNAIFINKDRYLGVTIDDGVAPAETEITPRQQLVTTAFAFRAKVAESVAAAAVTTAMIANNAVTTIQLGDSAVNSTKIADLSIATADIADGAITAAKLGTDIGAWTTGGGNVYRTTGKVGVGTSTPTALFSAGSAVGNNKIAVYDDGASARMGLGYQSGQLRIHTNASTDKISFLNGEAGTEILTLLGNGRVGIGRTNPGATLSLGTTTADSKLLLYEDGIYFSGLGYQFHQMRFFNTSTASTARFSFLNGAAGTEVFTIANTGQVGVGMTTPGFPLSFADAVGDKITLYGQSGGHYGFGIQNSLLQIHTDGSSGDIAFGYGTSASMTETMRIKGNGNIGIGTNSPTKGKVEISGFTSISGFAVNTAYNYGGSYNQTAANPISLSLYANGDIGARQFLAFSDERIKRIAGRSDPARDLAILQNIEVTDYTYIDTIAKGARSHKKVIAQQVEKVFPQAVSRGTDEVPDIYKNASIKDRWISLATDLKKGERVRLIGGKKEGIFEVLDVAEGKFRTDFAAEDGQVFVFGREVKDFRTVDYDAIAMLNVSATQQINKEKDALAVRVSELEKQNAALAAQNSAALSRLEALEKRFQSFARIADTGNNR